MFVSPSKLKKDKILKNRTLNFETVQKTHGNMILVPSRDREAIIATFNAGLFRPMQLLASFVPRRIKPFGRKPVVINQKDFYSSLRSDTKGRFKKGKTIINAYNGQNLYYDMYEDYRINTEVFSKIRKSPVALQKVMMEYFADKVNDLSSDPDYPKTYVIFPMYKYVPKLKQTTMVASGNIEPFVLFLKQVFQDKFPQVDGSYKNVDLFIFFNPNANAMVVVDLKDPQFKKDKAAIFQKILRLNNFNTAGAEHDELDDAEVEVDIPEDELSEEDKTENKKEELKQIVLRKVAKTLKADNITDFEAATPEEKTLITTIDRKVDDYLDKKENLQKTFSDLVDEVETDTEVKAKAIQYVETKKIAAQRLETHASGLEKEVEIISSIQDLDDDSKDNDADKFEVKEDKIDDRIKTSHLSSLDDEYNKKQAMTDMTNVISAFSNSDYVPLTVSDVQFSDSSDHNDLKKTLSVRYKTDDGKPLSFQLDVPDIIDKRYLYLGGNKKVIKKQLIRLPVVKTKADRVEITTNFNKMTIERTSGKLSRRNAILLKKIKEFTNNPNVEIEYGYNAATNSRLGYNNDFEYEELASSITSIKTIKYYLIFNREQAEEEAYMQKNVSDEFFSDKNNPRTPLGFERKGADDYSAVIFIDNKSQLVYKFDFETKKFSKVNETMFKFISENVLNLDMSVMPSIGKSFVYTILKFLKSTYPLFAVIGSQIGLTATLKKYNISYTLVDKQIRGGMKNTVEVKFKDKYMYYEDTMRATLLLNPLYLMHTTDYTFDQFDTDAPYTHFFMESFGDSLGIHVKNTLKVNLAVMVDPITKDVLKDLKMPTNIYDLLLYSNSLLVGNQYKPQNDLTNFRVRSNELVADIMYKIIAGAYVDYQKHKLNGRPLNMSVPKNALVKELLSEPNINDKSTLNPTIEAEQIAQASAAGFMGVNLESAYTLQMRAYDESMNGFISGNATPYSGKAGITRSLAYDPKISSVRGYIPDNKGMELSATNMLSPTELLASFTSAGADSPRQAMQVSQTGHTMPIISSSKQLMGTGMNKTIAYLLSDDFCFHAKKDGKVNKIDTKNKLALLDYNDGTRDAIDLSDKLNKNSNMGFYIHQNFQMCFTEGEKFKEGDILAYNPSYFSGKGKNIDYKPGTLAKIAIASGDFSFEDSTMISESLAEKCASKINMLKQVVLGKNAIIYSMKDVGDKVATGDAIIDFTSSFDDPDASDFIAKLSKDMDTEYLDEITHEQVKAKFAGTITDIKILYNCPFEELSPSLQNIIKKYRGRITARQAALNGIKADSVHIPPLEQVSIKKDGREEFPAEGGVIIDIWTEYIDVMGMGDKLTYNTALKGVVSRVLSNDEAPLTEYRSDEPIEGILTPTGYISRMTSDIYKLMFSNKVLVELGKQIREIWRGKR